MPEALATYLHHHLAGAKMAIEILDGMRDKQHDSQFRELAETLLPEVQVDDQLLRSIAESVGAESSVAKQAGGWILEKLARFKLGHTGPVRFETFETLEFLAIGIYGKLSLWKALRAASGRDARLQSFNFDELIQRATQQYDRVEAERLNLAQVVLAPEA